MCFSAEASFTAAAVLAVTGIVGLKLAAKKRLFWLALIPLLFATQQLAEGFLWLYLPNNPNSMIAETSGYIFQFFAYLFWPVYVPFAIMIAEPNRGRQGLIAIALLLGIVESIYFLSNATAAGGGTSVDIVNHSIQYSPSDSWFKWTYLAIVAVPSFISSLHWIKAFGVLVVLSFIVADYFYTSTFVSVWCFFSAVISITICCILYRNR